MINQPIITHTINTNFLTDLFRLLLLIIDGNTSQIKRPITILIIASAIIHLFNRVLQILICNTLEY